MGNLTDDVVGMGSLGVCGIVLVFSPGAERWDELDAMLVESQGMAEMDDGIVGTREWQVLWDQSDRLYGVPRRTGMRR